ncbi:hypothetical protein G9A89_017461 [Geosiphon pyriformis]|nr:hypothetical protein G9A89_017461 [Geosiphon pyriformis]
MPSGLQFPPPQPDFGTVTTSRTHMIAIPTTTLTNSSAVCTTTTNGICTNPKAITANNWDDARAILAIKPQNFNEFKTKFLRYFSNNNSINKLANTFTTIKQGETKAVTTYLGQFHRNLRQIQAIQADYFTDAVTNAQDFEAAELEANHVQAINLIMNRSFELDSKLKQFSDSINQKLEGYLTDNHTIYQLPQQCNNSGNTDLAAGNMYLPLFSISTRLPTYDAANISNTNDAAIILISSLSASNSNLSTTVPTQLSATVSGKLSAPTTSNTATELTSKQNSKTEINTAKLKIVDSSSSTNLHLKDFKSPRSLTRQQEPLQTSSNLLDFLAKNQSEHSETVADEENDSEITEEKLIDSENKENKMTAYIAKILEFNGEDIETSPQEWLNQVTKAGDANE